jgi:hypothetical protein
LSHRLIRSDKLNQSREESVADANYLTVTVKRVAESTDVDPHFTMPAHSLNLSPDGHLNIHGQYQSRGFSRGAWASGITPPSE